MLLPEGYKIMQLPNNPDLIADQRLFQTTFGHGDLPYPQLPPANVRERRYKLVNEEMYQEFDNAHQAIEDVASLDPDDPARDELLPTALAAMGDAIADSIYVLIGTAFEYGLPIAEIWREVQRANMAKLWTAKELNTLFHSNGGPDAEEELLPEYAGYVIQPATSLLRMDKNLERCFIVYNQHGKVMKPPGFRPPDIEAIVRKAYHDKANPSQTPPDQEARRQEWLKAVKEGVYLPEGQKSNPHHQHEGPTPPPKAENQDTTEFPTKPCRICGKKDRPQYKGICNDDHCSQT